MSEPEEDIDLEIQDLVFLTPAKITINNKGKKDTLVISVDLVNKKAYLPNGDLISYNDLVFQYLENVNTPPEDFFAAPEEAQESAREAQRQSEVIMEQFISDELDEIEELQESEESEESEESQESQESGEL
jgi:hypothetical protein